MRQWLWLGLIGVAFSACSAKGTQTDGGETSTAGTPGAGGGMAGTGANAAAGSGGLNINPMPDQPEQPLGDKTIRAGQIPDGAETAFATAKVVAGGSPELAYPTPGTMFPPNIARILFQWQAPQGSVFNLHFETPTGTLNVYTDGANPTCLSAMSAAQCWESDADTLLPYLKRSAGKSIKLTIRALAPAGGGEVWESAPYEIHVGPAAVSGAIYYWSTTAQGIRRGTLDGRDAADFLTPPLAREKCVACHTLSRSGKRMTVSFPGDLLGVTDVVETVPPPVGFGPPPFEGGQVPASWATFSPDDSKLVVAGQGVLSLVSAADARPIGPGVIALPQGVFGTMPDWAPDGKHLVFASITQGEKARHLKGSSIAWLSVDGDTFSDYQLVAESKRKSCGEVNEAYANPMFSPDSKWLAFSHADCESENDPTARIVLTRAAPNAEQFELAAANSRVGSQSLERLQNGMPTWAPTIDSNIAWIAFTSTRDYGLVLRSGAGQLAMRQLWVAAVDLSRVGQGDPSYPAFRLPAQDLNENNHRPFWAIDVLPPDWRPPVK